MTTLSHPEPCGSMATSRAWRGAAILSRGFRPFFLAAGILAVVGMALWPAIFTGAIVAPTEFSAVDWHAHEMIFGYGAAVIAGFLLTAIPNWTGRLPVAGVPLAALVGLWAAGRIAVFASAAIGRLAAAVIELVKPNKAFAWLHRAHWLLLVLSVVTILGAAAGSQGWSHLLRSGPGVPHMNRQAFEKTRWEGLKHDTGCRTG